MRADVSPSHDTTSFYLRWEIVPEGAEKTRLNALGGPVWLEFEVSCLVDTAGNRHETAKVKVPIWPYPGPKNLGQARFYDVDARRRFWMNLQEAVGTTAVDFAFEAKPGSVPKEGVTLTVPERPAPPARPARGPATSPSAATP
jgi:hypothetical protein